MHAAPDSNGGAVLRTCAEGGMERRCCFPSRSLHRALRSTAPAVTADASERAITAYTIVGAPLATCRGYSADSAAADALLSTHALLSSRTYAAHDRDEPVVVARGYQRCVVTQQ